LFLPSPKKLIQTNLFKAFGLSVSVLAKKNNEKGIEKPLAHKQLAEVFEAMPSQSLAFSDIAAKVHMGNTPYNARKTLINNNSKLAPCVGVARQPVWYGKNTHRPIHSFIHATFLARLCRSRCSRFIWLLFSTTLHLPVCLCLVFGILEQGVLINSWFQIAYINVDIFMAIIVRCLPILIYRLKSFSYKPRLPHFDWGAKEK